MLEGHGEPLGLSTKGHNTWVLVIIGGGKRNITVSECWLLVVATCLHLKYSTMGPHHYPVSNIRAK